MIMRSTLLRILILFTIVLSGNAAAVDKAFLRRKTLEVADACCPDGSRILKMSSQFDSLSLSGDFTSMIAENSERACVTSINTIVHEQNHTLHTFMAREVFKQRFGRFSDVYYDYDFYYLKDGQFTIMKKMPVFPSREMVPTIPERLRTFRFATYIDTDEKLQSTQQEGIFGLLDEFNSYTQGTRAAFDLLPYYVKKGAQVDWHDYFMGVNTTYYGCLEFKYYILKYLMYAQKRHPKAYDEIMKRKDILYTFLEVEKNASDLIQAYFDRKPAIYDMLRSYGWKVSENESALTITRNKRTVSHINFMGVYTLLQEEMKKPEYQSMMRTIREKAEGWDPESVYGEVQLAMKKMKMDDTEGGIRKAGTPRPEDWLALEKGEGLYDLKMDFHDPRGDVGDAGSGGRFSFVDLVNASISKKKDALQVRIQVAGLPGSLSFNQTGVDDNQIEYQWRTLFDLEGNGTDDCSLDVIHFKYPGSRPVQGGLSANAEAKLWTIDGSGASAMDVNIPWEIQGNEMVFEIPPCPFVSQVQNGTRIRFSTYYTDGKKGVEDFIPN